MNPAIFIGLVDNAALLLALGFLYDAITLNRNIEKSASRQLLTGVIIGATAIAVMLTPWEFEPGLIFDTRSILFSIAGLFFGFAPTVIAVIISVAFRLYQGGIGAWTGVAVIITSGGIGVAWRHLRHKNVEIISLPEMCGFGLVVHVAMLLWMLSLPRSIAFTVLVKISLPVMLLYPITTALLGKLMTRRLSRQQAEKKISRLAAVVEQATETVVITNVAGDIVYANPYFETSSGYPVADVIGKNPRILKSGQQDNLFYQNMWETIAGGRTWQGVFINKRKDGHLYHEEAVVFPVKNAAGKIINYAAVKRDISNRVKLQTALELNRQQLRRVSRHLFNTQEETRRRLALDLHDNIGQALTALKISQELLWADLLESPAVDPALPSRLQEAVDLTDDTLTQVRAIAKNLHPPTLDTLGLNSALNVLCQSMTRHTGLVINYQGAEVPDILPQRSIALYRILQEALTNVVKHAQAEQVRVTLRLHKNTLTLTVQDDGRGFTIDNDTIDEAYFETGIGLAGIKERADWLGGRAELEAAPDDGARLTVSIPVPELRHD